MDPRKAEMKKIREEIQALIWVLDARKGTTSKEGWDTVAKQAAQISRLAKKMARLTNAEKVC